MSNLKSYLFPVISMVFGIGAIFLLISGYSQETPDDLLSEEEILARIENTNRAINQWAERNTLAVPAKMTKTPRPLKLPEADMIARKDVEEFLQNSLEQLRILEVESQYQEEKLVAKLNEENEFLKGQVVALSAAYKSHAIATLNPTAILAVFVSVLAAVPAWVELWRKNQIAADQSSHASSKPPERHPES